MCVHTRVHVCSCRCVSVCVVFHVLPSPVGGSPSLSDSLDSPNISSSSGSWIVCLRRHLVHIVLRSEHVPAPHPPIHPRSIPDIQGRELWREGQGATGSWEWGQRCQGDREQCLTLGLGEGWHFALPFVLGDAVVYGREAG